MVHILTSDTKPREFWYVEMAFIFSKVYQIEASCTGALLQSALPRISHPLQITHSRWCERGGSAESKQNPRQRHRGCQGQDPACAGATAESGCSCGCTQLPLAGFIPAKPRKTLAWSIVPLSENSVNPAAAPWKGSDGIWVRRSPGLASARHQVSPTSWSTRIGSRNAALPACSALTGTTVTCATHRTRKDRHFPLQNRLLFVSGPVQVSLVNSPGFTVTLSLFCRLTEKENPTQLWSLSPVPMKDVGVWGCHVLSLNKETQACPSPKGNLLFHHLLYYQKTTHWAVMV